MTTTHEHYSLYGSVICSDTSLSELFAVENDEKADIVYRFIDGVVSGTDEQLSSVNAQTLETRTTNVGFDFHVLSSPGYYWLRWPGACVFRLASDGSAVTCGIEDSRITPHWLNSLFYGVVLSFLLHLRGQFNLHAGGVVTPGGAIGLLASAGTGKSTLTAHLAKSGLPFVTDDIVAPVKEGDGYMVPHGFPYVSLTAESIESVFGSDAVPDDMEFGNSDIKNRIEVDGEWANFAADPQPLVGLLVLSRGESELTLKKIGKQAAVMALVEHSVALPVLPNEYVSRHMARASEVVGCVPVWSLEVPAGLENISKTVEFIRQKFG